MVFDKTGALANVKRHDYLPFGEELFAGTGGRTTALGYTNNDGVRQKFTHKEREIETSPDYFLARCPSTRIRKVSAGRNAFDVWAGFVYTQCSSPLLGF
jgi:hypothetical protein